MKMAILTPVPSSLAALLLCLLPSTAAAVPVPAFDLHFLSTNADVIVVGKMVPPADVGPVLLDTPAGQRSARAMNGTVLVDRVLKGTASASISVQFSVPQEFIGYGRVVPDTLRVYFLKTRADHYEFLSPYYPSVAAGALTVTNGMTPYERVVEAIAAAVRAPDTALSTKREAIQTLYSARTAAATTALRSVVHQGDASLRWLAVVGLLLANDVSVLPMAEAALQQPENQSPVMIRNMQLAIADGVRDPAAVPTLGRMLRLPERAG